MRARGVVLMMAGVVVTLLSLVMDTSVGDTHNLAKAQAQTLVFSGGCVLFLAGTVFLAVGELNETIFKLGRMLRHQHRETISAPVEPVTRSEDVATTPDFREYAPTARTAEEQQGADNLYRGLLIGCAVIGVLAGGLAMLF